MKTVSEILGIIGLLFFILSFIIKGKNMKSILLCTMLGNLIMAISYLCAPEMNLNGALSSFIGIVISLINSFFAIKQRKIPLWLLIIYSITFVAVNMYAMLMEDEWNIKIICATVFAIIAVLSAVFSLSSPSGKYYRLWSLANDVFWSVSDILKGSTGPLITHSALIIFTLTGLIIYDLNLKKYFKRIKHK